MLWILILVTGIGIPTLVSAQSKRPAYFDEDAANEPDHPVPIVSIQGVVGQKATLPCNMTTQANDALSMVLWFKEDSGEPLYSFDARNRQFGKEKVWSAPHYWGNRASFRATTPQLTIQDVRQSDEGVYRCRVDFRNSPTRNAKVNFTIIVPPAKPVIYDAKRRDMSQISAAYPEGSDLELVCEVHGVRPLMVEILDKNKSLSVGVRYEVKCRSAGSKPPAVLTWWRASKQLKKTTRNFQDGVMSVSVLQWIPSVDDEGKFLACRAENPKLPDAAIEDRWKLEVHYAPIVTLKMDSSLNPREIKEGDDVYFECNVKANPRVYKLTWYHEDKELRHNASAGIVLSDYSLALQVVSRESSGRYTCRAANAEGHESSNVVNLQVMFAPICKHVLNSGSSWRHQNATPPPLNVPEELHGASKHESISLVCEVEANPSTVAFHWTFNSSLDLSDIPSTKFTSDGTVSRLNYTPATDMDYGTLGCWASNLVGQSKQPCLYQAVAAGRPFPLQNCTAYNQSGSWVRISCVEGYDGGLPQKFVAIVDKQRLESANPYWELELHKPTTVTLYAVNMKGSSDPVVMEGVSLKGVAKFTEISFTGESVSSVDMSPILIGLGGTATGLGLIVTGVLMALWRRHAQTPAKPKQPQQPSVATFTSKGEEEDGNPDLIPTTILSNNLKDRKLPVYGSLPRRPRQLEGREMSHDVLEDSDYPRATPNTFYSLQRPNRYSETIIRSAAIQESCI
ncbi:kin of IRRE-like protein 2 isoform X5 [Prorops nasuta]|uniref:kin of IRRE-like protein 2 isoform X5 n=1 Tax=Prorops nasuta TaxID=863751 RepID=UPI0034D01056